MYVLKMLANFVLDSHGAIFEVKRGLPPFM